MRLRRRAIHGRPGWHRLSAPGDKCGATWEHESGWRIMHCGHPTAIWPYFALEPATVARGEFLPAVVSDDGRGFIDLEHAMTIIELHLWGDYYDLVDDGHRKRLVRRGARW